MSRQKQLIAGAALFAALFFAIRKANAATPYYGPIDDSVFNVGAGTVGYHDPVYTENDSMGPVMDVDLSETVPAPVGYHDPVYTENDSMLPTLGNLFYLDASGFTNDGRSNPNVDIMTEFARVNAFLYMIRACEHVFPTDTAYTTFYGGSQFQDMSDHPVITGEKVGVRLTPEMCRNAGITSGVCVSTAAGAYQFTRPTWEGLRKASKYGERLVDFSPMNQDSAAVRLLMEIGAYPLIVAGDFTGALYAAGKRWASLPGAIGKQGQKSNDYVLARYNEGLQIAQSNMG